jgi:hypothetical protein
MVYSEATYASSKDEAASIDFLDVAGVGKTEVLAEAVLRFFCWLLVAGFGKGAMTYGRSLTIAAGDWFQNCEDGLEAITCACVYTQGLARRKAEDEVKQGV